VVVGDVNIDVCVSPRSKLLRGAILKHPFRFLLRLRIELDEVRGLVSRNNIVFRAEVAKERRPLGIPGRASAPATYEYGRMKRM
jgi:hypothetical protein